MPGRAGSCQVATETGTATRPPFVRSALYEGSFRGTPKGLTRRPSPVHPTFVGAPPPNSQAPQIQLTPDKGGTGGLWLQFRAVALSADSAPPQVTPKEGPLGVVAARPATHGLARPMGKFYGMPRRDHAPSTQSLWAPLNLTHKPPESS